MSTHELTLPVHVRDLTVEDLPWIGWTGGPQHPASVERALTRRATGEVDYLAVCGPADLPMAIGGIDYALCGDGGTLWQLATAPHLQSCGLGTLLIYSAEDRIRTRGLGTAYLSVEQDNVRAATLYQRLGYIAYDLLEESWDVRDEFGRVANHVALCTQMRKPL